MKNDLVLRPNAEREAQQAFQWYEGCQRGLGHRFLRALEKCLESIRPGPDMYAMYVKEYRMAIVPKFPFAVFYRLRGNAVVVYSIFQSSQDPKKLHRLLP